MVKSFCCLFLFFSSFLTALQDVSVSAEIQKEFSQENLPIKGLITITHDENEKIDPNSFRMENVPFKASLVKTVKMSQKDPVVVAIYQFELPAKRQGLYALPEISVKVGDKTYRSVSTSYEVIGSDYIVPTKDGGKQSTNSGLELKASVDGPTPLYPGQQANFVYKFYYMGNVELVEESLPLLDAKGFKKIGDKEISDSTEGGWNIQQISQKVQAISPGTYNFPASHAEGYAYVEDTILKKRSYLQPKLRSDTPSQTVIVNEFPRANKPASFSGGVGQFTITAKLLSPSDVAIGDKLTLALDIYSRDAQLSTVGLPSLAPLRESGLFKWSDLPPTGEVKDDTKRFTLELYPQSTAAKEIPSIPFSSFDPIANTYVTIQTDPIPISVKEKEPEKIPEKVEQTITPEVAPQTQPETIPAPSPIEISRNEKLEERELHDFSLGVWLGLWILPLILVFILLEIKWKQYLDQKKNVKQVKSSKEIWEERKQFPVGSPQFFQHLQQAFLVLLWEKGVIPSSDVSIDKIPRDGFGGEVREILLQIEACRFSGKEKDVMSCVAKAEKIFEEQR